MELAFLRNLVEKDVVGILVHQVALPAFSCLIRRRRCCESERFLGRGCDEALFSEKKGFFSEKGGGNSVNEGFGKERQFSEEVRAIH